MPLADDHLCVIRIPCLAAWQLRILPPTIDLIIGYTVPLLHTISLFPADSQMVAHTDPSAKR